MIIHEKDLPVITREVAQMNAQAEQLADKLDRLNNERAIVETTVSMMQDAYNYGAEDYSEVCTYVARHLTSLDVQRLATLYIDEVSELLRYEEFSIRKPLSAYKALELVETALLRAQDCKGEYND